MPKEQTAHLMCPCPALASEERDAPQTWYPYIKPKLRYEAFKNKV